LTEELIMKNVLAVVVSLIVLLASCSDRKPNQAIGSFIDSLMNASFKPNAPGAVVLVAKDGVPIFRKAYGLANLELNVPTKPEHVFAIGSMTKQFTAVCMLQLVQQGKVSLQDDIRKYLQGYNTHGRVITIENLLTHTSGIPSVDLHPEFEQRKALEQSQEEMLAFVMKDPLLFEPGSDYSYNDFGYYLAGLIIERVSGMRYSEYLQKNIFQPSGMKSSTTGTRENTIPLFVTGYRSVGGSVYRPGAYFNWKWFRGMGDILTSVDDMLQWDESLYTDKLVRRDLLEKAWSSFVLTDGRKTNYGYGWGLSKIQDMEMIYHAGTTRDFGSCAVRIPSQHIFAVVLTNNGSGYGAVVSAAQQTALRLAGKLMTEPSVRSLSTAQLSEYVGVYEMRHVWGGMLILSNWGHDKIYRYLTLQDTILSSQWGGGSKTALLNVSRDLFVLKRSNNYIRFQRDNNGRISVLESYSDPFTYSPIRTERRTDLPLPKAKVPISLDAKTLKSYAGKYIFGIDFSRRVRVEGSHIYADGIGEIFPESPTRFFSKTSGATVEFIKNSKGAVTSSFWTWLVRYEAKKVE
jgi:CubicO group peptidase (beta-lactamase class C family)